LFLPIIPRAMVLGKDKLMNFLYLAADKSEHRRRALDLPDPGGKGLHEVVPQGVGIVIGLPTVVIEDGGEGVNRPAFLFEDHEILMVHIIGNFGVLQSVHADTLKKPDIFMDIFEFHLDQFQKVMRFSRHDGPRFSARSATIQYSPNAGALPVQAGKNHRGNLLRGFLRKGEDMICGICGAEMSMWTALDEQEYWRCGSCALVRKFPFPTAAQERERYLLHNNDPAESGYRNYLMGLLETDLLPLAGGSATILDYGCGPTRAAQDILADRPGLDVYSYDPHFFPADPARHIKAVGISGYDLIFCNEVAEHMFSPLAELKNMMSLLAPDGVIIIGTQCFPEDAGLFASWWYRRDITHVHFFRPRTLEYAAKALGGAFSRGVGKHMYRIRKYPPPRARDGLQ
jgi:SAM-dependent methyltransferase